VTTTVAAYLADHLVEHGLTHMFAPDPLYGGKLNTTQFSGQLADNCSSSSIDPWANV
jgi:hypothetical protein